MKKRKFKTKEEKINEFFNELDELNISINKEQKDKLFEFIGNVGIVVLSWYKKYTINLIKYDIAGPWSEKYFNYRANLTPHDSSSLKSYVLKFGEEIGTKIHAEKTERCSLSLEKYIKKYGEKIGKEKWEKYCKSKASNGLEIKIEKYGKKLGKEKQEEYLEKWRNTRKINKENGKSYRCSKTLEEYQELYGIEDGYKRFRHRIESRIHTLSKDGFIERFGEIEGIKKYNQYCENHDTASLSSFIKRYGEEIGTKRYNAHCTRLSYCNSLDYYIEKYGEEIGEKKYKEVLISRCSRSGKSYSMVSQQLFWSLYEYLDSSQKENCFFAELNKEETIYIGKEKMRLIFCDFKIGINIIEFDGKYWHGSMEAKERDTYRDKNLNELGYNILRIPEIEYNLSPEKAINKCLQFLNNERS